VLDSAAYQKVIEEFLRQSTMRGCVKRWCRRSEARARVNYVGAGTVEFLVADETRDSIFWR